MVRTGTARGTPGDCKVPKTPLHKLKLGQYAYHGPRIIFLSSFGSKTKCSHLKVFTPPIHTYLDRPIWSKKDTNAIMLWPISMIQQYPVSLWLYMREYICEI